MKIWIYTGGRPSNSAKALAEQPGFRRFIQGKSFTNSDVLVNWGSTGNMPLKADKILNNPKSVQLASNKYYAFTALAGLDVHIVPWTANKAVAQEWQDAGSTIVVRTVLTGHSGKGIIIVEKGQPIPDAPLYTKYIFKEKEYRVHATRSKVIDTQRKVRDPIREPISWKIRSHDNGFIFQRNNIQPSEIRDELAMSAIKVLGLHFGAVDIVEDKHGKFYILEVNTAPGLEGQTVEAYTNALKELAGGAIA